MSDHAMPGFALRGDEAAGVQRHIRAVRSLERERRIMRLSTIATPWIFTVCLAGIVAADRYERAQHPLPQPQYLVSVVRANGISPPVRVADLTPGDEATVLRSTIANYVAARESYCWTCRAARYKHVSAISAPDERARYQAVMLNDRDPANPTSLYGTGLRAGIADVDPSTVDVREDPDSPNVFTAAFKVTISMPNETPRTVSKFATMQWLPAENSIEPGNRQAFSPLGIGCWGYTSYTMETPR